MFCGCKQCMANRTPPTDLGAPRFFYDTDNAWADGYEQALLDMDLRKAKEESAKPRDYGPYSPAPWPGIVPWDAKRLPRISV